MMLSAPLPGQEDRISETTAEEEGNLFMAAMAANTKE